MLATRLLGCVEAMVPDVGLRQEQGPYVGAIGQGPLLHPHVTIAVDTHVVRQQARRRRRWLEGHHVTGGPRRPRKAKRVHAQVGSQVEHGAARRDETLEQRRLVRLVSSGTRHADGVGIVEAEHVPVDVDDVAVDVPGRARPGVSHGRPVWREARAPPRATETR